MEKRSRKASDAAVASYWLGHDSTDEVDWSQPGVRLEFAPDVERPTRSVTVRLPRRLVQEPRANPALSIARAWRPSERSAGRERYGTGMLYSRRRSSRSRTTTSAH